MSGHLLVLIVLHLWVISRDDLMLTSVTRLGNLLHFGQLFKDCETIILSKSPTLFGYICKGVKIIHFSSEIIFGQLLWTFGKFLLVTLMLMKLEIIPWIRWSGWRRSEGSVAR